MLEAVGEGRATPAVAMGFGAPTSAAVRSSPEVTLWRLEWDLDGHHWQIYPLNLGEFVAIDRSIFVLHSGFGTTIKAPCLG